MLKFPMHGFAKRVDDTVTRAMTIIQNRENPAAKRYPAGSSPQPKRRDKDEPQR